MLHNLEGRQRNICLLNDWLSTSKLIQPRIIAYSWVMTLEGYVRNEVSLANSSSILTEGRWKLGPGLAEHTSVLMGVFLDEMRWKITYISRSVTCSVDVGSKSTDYNDRLFFGYFSPHNETLGPNRIFTGIPSKLSVILVIRFITHHHCHWQNPCLESWSGFHFFGFHNNNFAQGQVFGIARNPQLGGVLNN
jgi:hypothetical protein